ncbi:glycosyltransferase family 22 protein [Tricladium varicosporioides]|nr:glycosyltransferase family 22 protein [Hymenoscyphus varicosporioides]
MKPVDAILNVLLPTSILLHLLVAPYTKVEESFNIQATHDIVTYGIPTTDVKNRLQVYDHSTFPGAVPRTFIGALALAGIFSPILSILGKEYAQYIVRAVLGLFNAFCLLRFKSGLKRTFGNNVARWYLLLQVSQFHVIYYASRTLPNMFAFGLTTLAYRHFLPSHTSHHKRGIFFLVFAGVVFRSEVALILVTELASLLLQKRLLIRSTIVTGFISVLVAVFATTTIDSFFWQKPVWPELWAFYFNAVQGKAAEWGTSPFHAYFISHLPKLLLNPLSLALLIPVAMALPTTRYPTFKLVLPSLAFISIFSIQPHKEARFIIYVAPPLTAAAALSASYIWTRRTKNLIYRLGSLMLITSVLGSFLASTAMLLISSLNYPGGDAISSLHKIIRRTPWASSSPSVDFETIDIHMDVLSCMTGVTHFLEIPSPSTSPSKLSLINGRPTLIHYDKTEDKEILLEPSFWGRFDYALMEEPEKAIGKWDIIETIYAYAGIEFLRPGDGSSFSENMERVYAANNITAEHDWKASPPDSEEVKAALETGGDLKQGVRERQSIADLKARLMAEEMGRFGTFNLLRDAVRMFTGGWWIGPRMRPKIRILRRVRDDVAS